MNTSEPVLRAAHLWPATYIDRLLPAGRFFSCFLSVHPNARTHLNDGAGCVDLTPELCDELILGSAILLKQFPHARVFGPQLVDELILLRRILFEAAPEPVHLSAELGDPLHLSPRFALKTLLQLGVLVAKPRSCFGLLDGWRSGRI